MMAAAKSWETYEILQSEQLGRYMVAAKDLEMGEIILEELPLISAPQRNEVGLCPGCYKPASRECNKCFWPICSQDCTKKKIHQTECDLLVKAVDPVKGPSKDWKTMSECLMLVRCLSLKHSDPEQWKTLWNMEPNWDKWSRSPLVAQCERLIEIIRQDFGISSDDHSTEEIQRIQAILDINAYEVRLSETSNNIQASYALASIAEHNCVPNTHRVIAGENLLLTLRASTNIEKGTHLTTSYCDMLWPTLQRQKYLQWSKFFMCQCDRCMDPTDNGSYLSSLLCPICPNLTPVLPLPLKIDETITDSTTTPHKCTLCAKIFDGAFIQESVTLAETELEALDKDVTPEKCGDYEAWISKWSVLPEILPLLPSAENSPTMLTENTEVPRVFLLHPNHCLVLDACHTAFLLYPTEETTPTEQLIRKENMGKHLLNATKSIFNGISKFQGTIKYELASVKVALLMRFLEDATQATNERIESLAKESMSMMQESIDLLQYEPVETPEGVVVNNGSIQLLQLKYFVQEMFPDLIVVQ